MTKEEAIEEVNKVFEPAFANYIITALTEGATVSDIHHRWGQAYETGVKDGLEQEPKWIPVTEGLPDEGYSVLVMRITDENYKYMRVATYQGDCWMDDTDIFNKPNPHKVIAWMPLPQPYKAESEEG